MSVRERATAAQKKMYYFRARALSSPPSRSRRACRRSPLDDDRRRGPHLDVRGIARLSQCLRDDELQVVRPFRHFLTMHFAGRVGEELLTIPGESTEATARQTRQVRGIAAQIVSERH